MVSAAAIATAKATMGKQLCPYGGYRSQCPARAKCLNRHYDDNKEPAKSYSMRNTSMRNRTSNNNSNMESSTLNEAKNDGSIDKFKGLKFDVPRYSTVKRNNRLNNLYPVHGHDYNDFYSTGLRNMGNTCYLNAIIQSLTHTDSFITNLMKMSKQMNLKTEGLTSELALLAMVLKSGEYRRLTPVNLREQLIKVDNVFDGYKQHDAHEALTCILNAMEEELQTLTEGKELLSETFNTEITTRRKCTQCNDQTQSVETFPALQIQIPQHRSSIQRCVEEYMKPELIKNKRRWQTKIESHIR